MPTEEAKKNYPGKWKQSQQSAQEVYGLEPGTEAHRLKSEQLFVELGGGCVTTCECAQAEKGEKQNERQIFIFSDRR